MSERKAGAFRYEKPAIESRVSLIVYLGLSIIDGDHCSDK